VTAASSVDALAGWADEMRSAYLYRIVADVERGTPREKLFRELAGEAESQAAIWAESARKQGGTVPPRYVPDARAKVVAALVRRHGPRAFRMVLAAMKVRGLSVYTHAQPGHPRPTSIEDMQARLGAALLDLDAKTAGSELRRIKWDTWSGMFYSDITAYFIILATAVTLNVAGVTDINTAAQAATALRPLAGDFAYILFALGILGVGLIGVPVLAGSAAYALSEAMGWKWGLERKATDARGFYGVIAVSVLVGLGIQYSPISPMKALFWSAVINGVVAVPLMVVIILLVSKKSVMGAFTATRSLIVLGWIATTVMGAAAIRMVLPG